MIPIAAGLVCFTLGAVLMLCGWGWAHHRARLATLDRRTNDHGAALLRIVADVERLSGRVGKLDHKLQEHDRDLDTLCSREQVARYADGGKG